MPSPRQRFDDLWGVERKPQKTKISPPDILLGIEKIYPDAECAFGGVGCPCDHRPTTPRLLMRQLELARLGIPRIRRVHETLMIPLCDTCRYLYYYLNLEYRCRSTYRSMVREILHVSTGAVAEMISVWECAAKEVIRRRMDVARDYLGTLMPMTNVVDVYYDDAVDELRGKVVWVDIVSKRPLAMVFSLWLGE